MKVLLVAAGEIAAAAEAHRLHDLVHAIEPLSTGAAWCRSVTEEQGFIGGQQVQPKIVKPQACILPLSIP